MISDRDFLTMEWREELGAVYRRLIALEITLSELTSRSVKLHRFGNQKIVPL